ncbi:hypothetical protein Syun_021312 [Stephania yunnanensis]|uniref:Uncharacterized protein n=1 Tax=Stephania yunnanensis TaxID=152371 RepID=A0AAP0IFU2_9MAGN
MVEGKRRRTAETEISIIPHPRVLQWASYSISSSSSSSSDSSSSSSRRDRRLRRTNRDPHRLRFLLLHLLHRIPVLHHRVATAVFAETTGTPSRSAKRGSRDRSAEEGIATDRRVATAVFAERTGTRSDQMMLPSPKTALRSCARRRPARNQKALGEENPETSKPATRTQRRTRKTKQEDDQENEDHNTELIENPTGEAIPKTPATRDGRRRAAGNSVVKAQRDENEIQGLSVSQVCSTRRSSRLQSKASETDRKTGRRTDPVRIAALSKEESEEVSDKSTPVVEGVDGVSSGENAIAEYRISAEKDAPTAAVSDEASNLITSDIVTDQTQFQREADG